MASRWASLRNQLPQTPGSGGFPDISMSSRFNLSEMQPLTSFRSAVNATVNSASKLVKQQAEIDAHFADALGPPRSSVAGAALVFPMIDMALNHRYPRQTGRAVKAVLVWLMSLLVQVLFLLEVRKFVAQQDEQCERDPQTCVKQDWMRDDTDRQWYFCTA